jgi:hypothetical protein
MQKPVMRRRDILKLLSVFGVGMTQAAGVLGQSAPSTVNAGGKIVFENEKVRVNEHLAKPKLGVCGTGMHSHPPHLSICLTDIKAKITLPGKEPFIAENKAGDVFWDPGGPHVVENVGARDSKAYMVELKSAS